MWTVLYKKIKTFSLTPLRQIEIYIFICKNVYIGNYRLLSRLLASKTVKIDSTLFFVFNVVAVTISPLISEIPDVAEPNNDFLENLTGINSLSAGTFGTFIGYMLGAVAFSLLLSKFLSKRYNNRLYYRYFFQRICLSSAWFWPLVLVGKIYDQYGYFNVVHILQDISSESVSVYMLISLAVTIFVWIYLKYRWIDFIVYESFIDIKHHNESKLKFVASVSFAFLLVCYTIPLFSAMLSCQSIILTNNYQVRYYHALEHKDDASICSYGTKLVQMSNLPKDTRFEIWLTTSVITLCGFNKEDAEFEYFRELAYEQHTDELERVITFYLENNPIAHRYISSSQIDKFIKMAKNDESVKPKSFLSTDLSFTLFDNFILTPYDNSTIKTYMPTLVYFFDKYMHYAD